MRQLITALNVCAGYGETDVIRDVSLHVSAGEIVALLGANGAGKTTLMLTLAGEIAVSSGEVQFNGMPGRVPLYRRARNGLGLVTEDRSVFMQLTTRQNLGVGRCRIDDATALFPELRPLLSRRAGLLSGGEQQMLTLGRALGRPTELLLVDELSRGLAPALVGRLLRAVRAAADRGLGVLLVEQHVHRVLDVADRVIVLRQGRVAFSGSAAEARANLGHIEAHYLSNSGDVPG